MSRIGKLSGSIFLHFIHLFRDLDSDTDLSNNIKWKVGSADVLCYKYWLNVLHSRPSLFGSYIVVE